MKPRIGSLCSGYGGLELGLMAVVGGSIAWHVEYDKHPSAVLDARFPGVPNYGDITTTDWTQVEPVDWLTAGYPCQPFSHAGKRKGKNDERHLWPFVAGAIGVLRPRRVLLENVRGHVSLGLADVLADLSGLGYDAQWGVVPASAAGAPHNRARIFIVATDTRSERHGSRQDGRSVGRVDSQDAGQARERQRSRPVAGDRSAATPADADGERHERSGSARGRRGRPADGGQLVADASRNRRDEGRPEPARLVRRSDAAERGADASADATGADRGGPESDLLAAPVGRAAEPGERAGEVAWGAYGPAIRRWERVTGRAAPRPTESRRVATRTCELCGCPNWFHSWAPCLGQWWRWVERLDPRFVEWMMGLPEGWVTDVLPRNPALKALGNGVVPQQAALAISALLATEAVAA